MLSGPKAAIMHQGAPSRSWKTLGPDTCGVETFLLLMWAKHNYSVLHFSHRRFKHFGLEALWSCVHWGFPGNPPFLPKPTPTHFMKSDGDPLWPSQGPAGVKPIRRGYKMFLVFFLSVIKAVNYLLMEAVAVAAATGGPTTCRCCPWRDVNTFQVSCQECFRSMCATDLLWVVTRYYPAAWLDTNEVICWSDVCEAIQAFSVFVCFRLNGRNF